MTGPEYFINELEMGKEKDREWEILRKVEFLEGWATQDKAQGIHQCGEAVITGVDRKDKELRGQHEQCVTSMNI